jgi:hypothetical protein
LSSDSDISTVSSSSVYYNSASKQIQRHTYLRPRKLSLNPDFSLLFMEGLNFKTSDKWSELLKSFITLYASLLFYDKNTILSFNSIYLFKLSFYIELFTNQMYLPSNQSLSGFPLKAARILRFCSWLRRNNQVLFKLLYSLELSSTMFACLRKYPLERDY